MSEELKPCPICEGQYLNVCAHGGTGKCEWHIECDHCGCACPTESETEAEAYAAWNALPRRLKWTKEKPTEEGWYWLKEEGRHAVVKMTAGGMISEPFVRHVNEVDGEWAGPIPEPTD